MIEIIKTSDAPAPIGPYNQAIKVNHTLYASGQIAIDPISGNLKTNNLVEETEQVLDNLGAVLKAADMNYNNVVKCSIFLSNINDFKVVNEVYGKYFTENFPTRETVEVSRLPKDVNIEISLIAVDK